MAVQTVYACDIPYDASGVCLGNSIAYQIDNDLALALNNHSTALTANVTAMDDFFTLSSEDVAYISASMLVFFLVGLSAGRVAKLFRKA